MDNRVQDSHLPSRVTPKDMLHITGSSYKSFDMDQHKVGDTVKLLVEGTIKAQSQSSTEEEVMDYTVRVEHIDDATPRSDRDETNRLKI